MRLIKQVGEDEGGGGGGGGGGRVEKWDGRKGQWKEGECETREGRVGMQTSNSVANHQAGLCICRCSCTGALGISVY